MRHSNPTWSPKAAHRLSAPKGSQPPFKTHLVQHPVSSAQQKLAFATIAPISDNQNPARRQRRSAGSGNTLPNRCSPEPTTAWDMSCHSQCSRPRGRPRTARKMCFSLTSFVKGCDGPGHFVIVAKSARSAKHLKPQCSSCRSSQKAPRPRPNIHCSHAQRLQCTTCSERPCAPSAGPSRHGRHSTSRRHGRPPEHGQLPCIRLHRGAPSGAPGKHPDVP